MFLLQISSISTPYFFSANSIKLLAGDSVIKVDVCRGAQYAPGLFKRTTAEKRGYFILAPFDKI